MTTRFKPVTFTVTFKAGAVLRDFAILERAAAGGPLTENIVNYAQFVANVVIEDEPEMTQQMRGYARTILDRANREAA
jgi:hypothetical protein